MPKTLRAKFVSEEHQVLSSVSKTMLAFKQTDTGRDGIELILFEPDEVEYRLFGARSISTGVKGVCQKALYFCTKKESRK